VTSARTIPGYTDADTARLVTEPIKEGVRSPFSRDRARVLHSAGLRRLAAKTQVLVAGQDDFPRTRLTHTLEVAQIARELGEALGCDPDVVEVAGLAHDLGHPPFGHNGEEELNRLADSIGGFEGNAQTLRVLTRLEAKVYDDELDRSVGLNLTRACLDASCKYPWPRGGGGPGLERKFGYYEDDADVFAWLREGAVGERTCLEEQVMDWSDDVAYSVHDVEDAVHVGLVVVDLFDDPAVRRDILAIARERYLPSATEEELNDAITRLTELQYWPRHFTGSHRDMVELKRFTSYLIGRFCVTAQIATQMAYGDEPLTTVAFVMQRDGAEQEYARQREIIAELVHALTLDEGRSLELWLQPTFEAATSDAERFRVIIDQVASLTDVSVLHWHKRLVR
jgi:dGTPase